MNQKIPIDEKIQRCEKDHHDRWAATINVSRINVKAHFESSTAPENRFILSRLGDLRDKRVLDIGCGAGESSVYFAHQGARCTAIDLSPQMIETTLRLAKKENVSVEAFPMGAAQLSFPDDHFDIVYAANLLHHVDWQRALPEMRRVTKPGGKVCFWDPLRHNFFINVYRKIAHAVRTPDEKPLDIHIVSYLKNIFREFEYDCFWFFTLWIFFRFYFIERVDPNKQRYWKKIIEEEERLRTTYLRLEKLDTWIKRIPWMKRFAWNIAVVATK